MRIRSIRPEFWSSEDIAAMDWHTRLVYIGLWSYVDDNGVGRDIERLIVADLFPLDDNLPEASRRVTGALRYLSDHGHITRYVVDGKRYLHIVKWSKHQRIEKASKGRYPQPDAENAELREPSPTTPGTLPEMSTLGEGEKGRRGEGEKAPAKRAQAARASSLPADWKPTHEHVARAAQDGVDIGHEVMKFRTHAEDKGRLSKSWNAAFTQWLIKAAEFQAGRPRPATAAPTHSPWDTAARPPREATA